LQRLENGERNLAVLASDLGFADQAHLTRTIRDHLGQTPTALRRLLHPAGAGHSPMAGRAAESSLSEHDLLLD
jgi:AraC-like DNA-binding protein